MVKYQPVNPKQIRKIILEQAFRAGVGHIGSALSVTEIIAALYGDILNIFSPKTKSRDRFVMSKGHAALALYAALYLREWIDKQQLDSYCGDASLLGLHPEHELPGVDFSTGSLGHGLPYGVGAALAARLQRSLRRVFVLVSDAECNEGSTWEAIMFAAHHQLANLIVIVDDNGQQALGYTKEVLDLSSLPAKWQAFNWDTHQVDGHNLSQIKQTIRRLKVSSGPPHVLIAKTLLGKGVSFMEGKVDWHYLSMSQAEYEQALKDVDQSR